MKDIHHEIEYYSDLQGLLPFVDNEYIYEAELEQTASNEIAGMRRTRGWVDNQYVYFAARFSKPFQIVGFVQDRKILSAEAKLTGTDYYIKYGFIPSNIKKESISCLLEFAYDDRCIARMAQEMGKEDIYQKYMERSQNYINVFDGSHAAIPATGRIALRKGFHFYKLCYFEDYEGEHLGWAWKLPSAEEFVPVPASTLYVK